MQAKNVSKLEIYILDKIAARWNIFGVHTSPLPFILSFQNPSKFAIVFYLPCYLFSILFNFRWIIEINNTNRWILRVWLNIFSNISGLKTVAVCRCWCEKFCERSNAKKYFADEKPEWIQKLLKNFTHFQSRFLLVEKKQKVEEKSQNKKFSRFSLICMWTYFLTELRIFQFISRNF